MTNEEVIKELENMRKFNYTLAPDEVFNKAIKALEHNYILERRLKHLLQSEFIRSFDEVDARTKEYKRDIREADLDVQTTTISYIAGPNGIYTGCSNCNAHIKPNPHFKFCPECGRKIIQ